MGEGMGISKGSLHTCEDLTLMKEEREKRRNAEEQPQRAVLANSMESFRA